MEAIISYFGEIAMKAFLLKYGWEARVSFEEEQSQDCIVNTIVRVTYSNDGEIFLPLDKAFEIELSNQVLKLL